jgi:uncharacterized protein (TIGR03663 family)
MNKKNFALYLVFILIIVLAFFLRLYHLDERVFHHDEAAVGYFTYKLFNDNIYSYDPSFHGPFMYYATAEIFRRLGDSDYSARLLPALFGAAMLFLLIPLRRYIGDSGTVLAAFFLALSPSFLYYSRFYREDIFTAFFTLLTLVCAVKYAEKYVEEQYSVIRVFYLFLGAASLASMAALKENTYIAIALTVLFLVLIFIREKWYKGFIDKLKKHDKKLLIAAVEAIFLIVVFLVVFSLYYAGKFLDFYGMRAAVEKAISHWYEMHRIQRMGGPMYFYLPILALYELPVLIFGVAGIIHYFKRNSLFMTFLGYWAMSNFIVYSYIQEKVPWLILNPLLPLTIIAGAYLGELLYRLKFNSRIGAAAVILLVISSSYFIYSSVLLNFYNYTDPAEPLIQAAQPPQKFSLFIEKINEISKQYQNQSTEIQLTDAEMETQFLWYMRHYSNIKWRVSIDSELTAPLIVVHDSDDNHEPDIVKQRLRSDYERLDSAKMSWYWFKPSDVTLDYLLYRKMDRAPGEYRVVLFYKPKY